MAEALKNVYSETYILELITRINQYADEFDGQQFHRLVFNRQWPSMELKQRMDHISRCLHDTLVMPFTQVMHVLKPVSEFFSGYEAMFFPHYVELYGMPHWQESMQALEHMTQYSSSEFAVRPFILANPDKMMQQMLSWATHANYHVRRLASEGCRPRLPWAISLPEFKQDPSQILPILALLKQDPSEYVRKSVANNLNDIAKDNPQLVRAIAKQWLGQHKDTDWIVKHGCRTLLKQGDSELLPLFGFHHITHIKLGCFNCQSRVKIGQELQFDFELLSHNKNLDKLRIEYAIDYVKANGKLSRKTFKISESHIQQKRKQWQRKQAFKDLSTRKHYPGIHHLSLIINGQQIAQTSFQLSLA